MEHENEKGKIKYSTFKRIVPFFKGHNRSIFYAVLSVLAVTAFTSAQPLVFRELIDRAIPAKEIDLIILTGLVYLGLLAMHAVVEYFQSLIVGYMGIEIVNRIKMKMLRHVLTLSIRFFDNIKTGKLMSRIESDAQHLYMVFSSVGLQILWAFLNILISLVIMLTVSVKLTMFVLAIVPIYVIGTTLIFKKMRPMYRRERELYSKITGFIGEHLKAVPVLRGLNNLDWSRKKLAERNENMWHYAVKIHIIEMTVWFMLMLAPQLAIAAILYQSVGWIKADLITIGTVWMFIQYIQMAIHPLIMISEQISEVQKSFGAADRIFNILDTKPEVKDPVAEALGEKTVRDVEFNDKIMFEDVSFFYDKEKPVLNNVSFSIEKGSTVAIVGATGSGKTTIISLLSRFYDPTGGKITMDGIDLRMIRKRDIRKKMSLVLQDIYLFPGNVVDNLRVLRQDIPVENVLSATAVTGIDKYIRRLSDGFQTELSEAGGNLSFGERQLLSFSRALTFDPEILVMDEATSSVDPHTEKEIQRSMSGLMKGRTCVVIAHRLSTVRDADKILVLDKGKLVEEGSHEVLMKNRGLYHHLYTTQTGELSC